MPSTHRAHTKAPEPGLSPLLNCPGEIRNMIYRLVLVKPHGATIEPDGAPGSARCSSRVSSRRVGLASQILRTCRHIHNEALPILYGENMWEISIRRRPQAEIRYPRALPITPQHNLSKYRSHFRQVRISIEYLPRLSVQFWASFLSADYECLREMVQRISTVLEPFSGIRVLSVQLQQSPDTDWMYTYALLASSPVPAGTSSSAPALASRKEEDAVAIARDMEVWLLLRKIKRVEVGGECVTEAAAQRLKQTLEGSEQPATQTRL